MTPQESESPDVAPSGGEVERVSREFTKLFHDLKAQTFATTTWLGVPLVKTPNDIVVFQQIIVETRPDLIVETGVYLGGSALLFATLMDSLGIDGKVIAIDIETGSVRDKVAAHPRIELIEGSSVDPTVVTRVRAEASKAQRVMVDLDSDHRAHHVLEELRTYSPLVTPGCYLVVEDGFLGGRPVRPDAIPGPSEALDAWFGEAPPFQSDRWHERYLLTQNPRGFLRRIGDGAAEPRPPRPASFVTARLELSGLDNGAVRAAVPAPEKALAALEAAAGETEGELDQLRRSMANMARAERNVRIDAELEGRRQEMTTEALLEELEIQRVLLAERSRLLARERARVARFTESKPYRVYRALRRIPGIGALMRWRDRHRLAEAKARAKNRAANRQVQSERFSEHHRGQ